MKKRITAILTAAVLASTLTAVAADFIIDIDDASHVTLMSGHYSAAYQEISIANGENVITQSGSEDFVLMPKEGWLIESITAYNENGTPDTEAKNWSFDSNGDSYSIYFIGSQTPPYKYVVKTKENEVVNWNLTFEINDASAIKGGSLKVGNQTVKPENGTQTFIYNPDKGKEFYMQLRPAVTEVTFLRNGISTEPAGTMSDGTRTYKFTLADNDEIKVNVVMETPDFIIDLDDPSHYIVHFPDVTTELTDLKQGQNKLQYSAGDRLYIKAADGWKIEGLGNMNFSSSSDTYDYQFKDGDSGIEFKASTVEYNPPTATVTVNIDNPEFVNYINLSNQPRPDELVAGVNTFTVNLDKGSKVEIWFKSRFDGQYLVAMDNNMIEITEDYWTGTYATLNLDEAGEYSIYIRAKLEGEWAGESEAESDNEFRLWTVTFSPAGIIERASDTEMPYVTTATNVRIEASEVTLNPESIEVTFNDELPAGNNKLNIPAGFLRINGATSPTVSKTFTVTNTGIDQVEADGIVRLFDLNGTEITNAAKGQVIIKVRSGKSEKTIVK